MPVNQAADYFLDNKPYMIVRGQSRGRAWHRTGVSDAPSRRSATDVKYGAVDDTLDHPEVWDDWSGGFGQAYRRAGENTYHWAEGFDARFPRQLVHCQQPRMLRTYVEASTGPWAEQIDGMMDPTPAIDPSTGNNSSILFAAKGGIWQMSLVATPGLTPPAWYMKNVAETIQASGTTQFLHRGAIFGSYAVVGNAGGTMFWWVNHSTAGLTVSMPGYHFVVAGNRLWRSHGPSRDRHFYLQSVADANAIGSTSGWSATLAIGDGVNAIKDLIALEDQVFVGMTNGLYAGDFSGTFINVLPDMVNHRHEDNCRDLTTHNGAIIAPTVAGVQAVYPMGMEAAVEDIGPPTADRSPVRGHVRTVRGYGPWLYAGKYTGSQSYLLAGNVRNGRYVWHTLQRFPHAAKIGRIFVDSITEISMATINRSTPRMWVAAEASIDVGGTAPVYWWAIPFNDGNPLSIDPGFSANYIGSARMDLGAVDWSAPGTPKVFRSVEVWADNLLSGYRYADLYYELDGVGSFALLGRAQASPKTTLFFSSGEGSFVTGQSIALSLRSFTASPALTPIYRSIVLRGALQPKSIDQITAITHIADNLKDRQGSLLRPGHVMIDELRTLARNGTVVQLIDLTGAAQWVKVQPPIEEQELYQQGNEAPEVAATVRMAVLEFS